jgi:hypothetical protein
MPSFFRGNGSSSSSSSSVPGGWDPLRNPQSPAHPCTDYFDADELDPKWTVWDVADIDVSVSPETRCHMVAAANAGAANVGIFQDAPGHLRYNVTILARWSSTTGASVFSSLGVLLGGDLGGNPSTAPFVVGEHFYEGTESRFAMTGWSDYNSVSSQYFAALAPGWSQGLIRAHVNTSDEELWVGYGTDGLGWKMLQVKDLNATVLSGVPTTIGIALDNVNQDLDMSAYVLMFRVEETDDIFAPVGGL